MLINFWNRFRLAIHHFWTPHCPECKFEKEQDRINSQNDLVLEYKEMLVSARLEISRLTQALVDLTKPPETIIQEVKTNFQPLPHKMRMSEIATKLNRESREEAMRLRNVKIKEHDELRNKSDNDLKEEVEKLESQLGVS